MEGEESVVKLLLDKHVAKETRDDKGRTALQCACANEKFDNVAKVLLEYGAKIDVACNDGYTPLHEAAYGGLVTKARVLVDGGADLNIQDNCRDTPLYEALYNYHSEVAKYLIEQGASTSCENDDGITPLHVAASKGMFEITKLLVDKGVDLECEDKWENTALNEAVQGVHVDVAQYLIEKGADESHLGHRGRSPLHAALFQSFHPSIGQIIQLFRSVDNTIFTTLDDEGNTPLHIACQEGNLEVVRTLLANLEPTGATISNFASATPLYFAAERGNTPIVQLLIAINVETNVQNEGLNPLHTACYYNHLETAKVLRDANPSLLQVRDVYGCTPLHLGAGNGSSSLVAFLLEKDAEIDSPDRDRESPLHWACYQENHEVAALLLDCGADVDFQDKWNNTPLYHACEKERHEVAALLLAHGADPNIFNVVDFETLDETTRQRMEEMMQTLVQNEYELFESYSDSC